MWVQDHLGVVVLVLLVAGCAQDRTSDAGSEPIVAVVGGRRLTVREVEASLRRQPDFMRARVDSTERKQEFIDGLVRNELLVQEARRRKLDESLEFREATERLLIQLVLADETKGREPSETEARMWFESHQSEFTRPERIQLAMIEFGASDRKPAPTRTEVERELSRLRVLRGDQLKAAFGALVLARSTHESSRSFEGDLGLKTRGELASLIGAEAAGVAFALSQPGELSSAVDSPRGLLVFRLVSKEAGTTATFEAEKQRVLTRMTAEKRTTLLNQLVARLRAEAKVSFDDEAIRTIKVDQPTLMP